ncbi:MAG: hypothetical protein IPM29_21550 [Planctomycetes bacterium]|nr:hypothetical protein [Planctomycetota bacterium]
MKRRLSPRTSLTLLSIAAVGWIAFGDLGRKAPGELTTAHGRVEALRGFGSCSECHGGWTSSMTASCLECHEPIATQLAEVRGLHGSLDVDRARACPACHSEHHGPDFAIVNRASFAAAGVPDPGMFDHRLIGYELLGAHVELACSRCHENADIGVLPAGQPRFLGLSRDCQACHEDPHGGGYVVDCTTCHGQRQFRQLEPARHERWLPLTGPHGKVACGECHAEGGAHGFERIGLGTAAAARTCADCHESPHARPFAAPHGDCADCHRSEHDTFPSAAAVLTADRHAAAGFELVAPHADLACSSCHGGDAGPSFAERHPGRAADDCAACHADPHRGQFVADHGRSEVSGVTRCVDCHARATFAPHEFDVGRHAATALPLDGRHLDAECRACHTDPAPGAARRFAGVDAHCAACHRDAHDGRFDAFAAALDDGPHGACASCHDSHGFDGERTRAEFDHARFTGFAVDGAHAQAVCEVCHPAAATPDAAGRRFGRVRAAFGELRGCLTCHVDPHRGGFDGPGLPAEIAGRTDCARCHGDTTFRVLRDDWDHAAWTGYALRGSHATVDCGDCHAPRFEPDARGRTWQSARGTACADCHDDVHAGQFDDRGRTVDCARCHGEERSFHDLRFRHDLDSGFPLGERHAKVACNECHRPARIGDSDDVVRYRGTPRDCADCHGDQRNPLRSGRGTR